MSFASISACNGTTATTATVEQAPTESVTTDELTSTNLQAGDLAPDFTLPDGEGNLIHLADELQNNKSVVLLFYLEHT